MATVLTVTPDRWEVDLGGRSVEMLTIDQRVTLHLLGGTDYDGSIILETPFTVTTGAQGAITVDPQVKAELTPVLECFGRTVAAVSVSRKEGGLTLRFT